MRPEQQRLLMKRPMLKLPELKRPVLKRTTMTQRLLPTPDCRTSLEMMMARQRAPQMLTTPASKPRVPRQLEPPVRPRTPQVQRRRARRSRLPQAAPAMCTP